jgi:hypothetical protein
MQHIHATGWYFSLELHGIASQINVARILPATQTTDVTQQHFIILSTQDCIYMKVLAIFPHTYTETNILATSFSSPANGK